MTDHITPETDAKLADGPQPSSDSPDYARALEIHIHLLHAELADERAKKSDALIAAVDDIERLTAERDAKQSQLKEVNSWLDECVKQRDDAAALARNYAARMARSDAELAILIADRGTLRAALELIAVPMPIDGTYIGRDECGYIAREALATSAK